jgi:hypothetical protein
MPRSEQADIVATTRAEHTSESSGPSRPFLRANAVTLAATAAALVLAGIVWQTMTHTQEISSVWTLLFKLTPFVAASVGIAWLDLGWARRLRLNLIGVPASFLVVFCVFVPRSFFYARQPGDEHYYTVLTMVPFIILALSFAYRLGGGSRGTTLRLAFAMLLLQLSGLEDLAYLTLNPHRPPNFTSIPEVWTWAAHITVFLGHPATKTQAYIFITVHVVLALLVLFLPARVVAAALGRLRRRS